MAQTLTVELPDTIYERVVRTAIAMEQPIELAVVHFIENGLPSLDIPDEFEADLKALEALDDDTLWEILKSRVPPTVQRSLHKLLDKNQAGTLTERERQKLEALQVEADRVMLRKAHAALLLKWRGHHLPNPDKSTKPEVYGDLDHLAGTWTQEEADEFDLELRAQRQIDDRFLDVRENSAL